MGLAPYFRKAALAASHILEGFDADAFAATLGARTVAVAFGEDAAGSPEARVTLDLLVNLLARLYPCIALEALDGPDGAGRAVRDRLAALALGVNPNIEITDNGGQADFWLAVGRRRPVTGAPVLFVGSDGWVAGVSPDGPVGSGSTANPFGACAAACFGAASAFRVLFSEQLASGGGDGRDGTWRMSLLDMDPANAAPPNPSLQATDLGEAHLVGVGAIGNAAVWALARSPGLRGTLHLIDDEEVDGTNPQRYVLAGPGDIGTAKSGIAARELGHHTGLTVRPHRLDWAAYLAARGDWRLDRVLAALDSARDRCAVQAALPRWTANAWTQTGDLGVSRHPSFGCGGGCLMCLYLPDRTLPNEDELVAQAIGLAGPDALMGVRVLLHNGAPIGRAWVERIAASLGLPVEPLLPFADRPLRAFYREAVCGGIVLSLGGNAGSGVRAEVPMAFQSALAGILLAVELIAEAGGLRKPTDSATVSRVDLLRSLGHHLARPLRQHPSGWCICQDVTYLTQYKKKYTGCWEP